MSVKNYKSILIFYFSIFRKYPVLTIFMLFLAIVRIGLSLLTPIITMKILDESIPNKQYIEIIMYSIIILGVTAISSLINYILEKNYSTLGKKIYLEFQDDALNQFINLTGDYYTNMNFGEVFNILYEDIEKIQGLISGNIFQFVIDFIVAIGVWIILFKLQWDLAVILSLLIPVILLFQSYYQKRGRKLASAYRMKDGRLIAILEDVISNIIPFQYSRCESSFLRRYKMRVQECKDAEKELSLLQVKNSGVLSFLSQLFIVVIIGYGGIKVVMGQLSIGGLLAFNMYGGYMVAPILEVSGILMVIQSNIISLDRINDFLSLPNIKKQGGNLIIQNAEKIKFEEVSFSYNKSATIKNTNILFKKNSITMIVGESGSGKSTLLNLLYRLWDCEDGKIKIDDIDIKKYDITSLRNNISIVGQTPYLINDTIYNNLTTQDGIGRERIEHVLRMVCLDELVKRLPNGLNTVVGENGVKLSGGEKQRICLARILLRDAPILIFDEATSALDRITEHKILNNISKEKENKIIVIITHRMENCEMADNIFVIKQGKPCGVGTHDALIRSNDYYKHLYKSSSIR